MDIQQNFELFGTAHWLTLFLIAGATVLLPLALRRSAPPLRRRVAYLLAALLVGQEAIELGMRLRINGLTVAGLLPLQLCTLAVYLTAWTLVTRNRRVYEVVYFWGLGGATQALVTPDLPHAFPHPAYLLFFLGHGLVILGVVYATVALGLRPYFASIRRVGLVTLGFAVAVGAVNIALNTNFLYLMAKPDRPSLLDWLGPWPWYLLSLIPLGLTSLLLWYSPFLFLDLAKRRRLGTVPRSSRGLPHQG